MKYGSVGLAGGTSMGDEFVENWERFFLQKIKTELERGGTPLSASDQMFLLTTVSNLASSGISGAQAKELVARSVGSLHRQYMRETGAGMSNAGMAMQSWRENNIQLYRVSSRIISCVVQKWYITFGREQELKLRRTAMLYTWYSADALKLWDTLIHASRIMPRRNP